jgi:signal transduction histidine kinase
MAQSRQRRARQERMSTIGQFLSSVLHDLKTPMTVISGYVKLMAEEGRTDVRKEFADVVLRQVEHINAMTRETLTFARGDTQLWVRKVYLHQFFEDLSDQLHRDLEGRGVELQLDLRDRGVALFDSQKIQRAIHNLARNAAEALGDEGGRIAISVDRRSDDGALVLTFEDNGPGIPEEIRDGLFDSFTTHGKTDGTGLGLAIVSKVVEDHGGDIDLHSEPGRTVFTLTLPQPPPNTPTRPPPPSSSAEHDSGQAGDRPHQ